LFSIEEQDEEVDDDELSWVNSPQKWLKSLMTPRSKSWSPTKSRVPSSPAGGDRANAPTYAKSKVPLLDAAPTKSSIARRRPNFGSNNENRINHDSQWANANAEECLFEVEDDKMMISPKIFPSLRLSDDFYVEFEDDRIIITPKVHEKHAKEAVAKGFDEATKAPQQEQFQVGETVLARDSEEQSWVYGVVSCADPLKVRLDGKSQAYSFQYVCSANGMIVDPYDVSDQPMDMSGTSRYDDCSCASPFYKPFPMLDLLFY
jgi:hypothetical protein